MATSTGLANPAATYASDVETAVFITELWTDAVRAAFKKKLGLGVLATDYSFLLSGGGDTVHIPSVADVAVVATKAPHVPVNYTNATEDKIDLTCTTHQYSSAMIDDMGVVQASSNLLPMYADSIAYRLAQGYENALEAQLGASLLSIDIASYQSSAKDVNEDTISEIVRELYSNNVNPEECWLVLGPRLYASMFKMDDFIHISKTNAANFVTGQIGSLMGLKVMMSNYIDATVHADCVDQDGSAIANDLVAGGYVVHKDALASAFSKKPTVNSEYDIDYVAHKLVGDMIYGCKLVQDASQTKCWIIVEAGVTSWA